MHKSNQEKHKTADYCEALIYINNSTSLMYHNLVQSSITLTSSRKTRRWERVYISRNAHTVRELSPIARVVVTGGQNMRLPRVPAEHFKHVTYQQLPRAQNSAGFGMHPITTDMMIIKWLDYVQR